MTNLINNEIDKKQIGYWVVAFLISPFISLILSIYYYKSTYSKNIFWLYSAFVGYTFVISSSQYDASRYRNGLYEMQVSNFSFADVFNNSSGSVSLDFVQRIMTFFVSQFTSDYRILFAVFGLFLGYFLSRLIWSIIDLAKNDIKKNLFVLLLIFSLSLVVGIWDIGGVRWNSAAVIFVFGVIQFVINKNKFGLILIVFSLFVHWSFTMAIGTFLIYFFLKDKSWIYYALFIVSFLFVELDLNFIHDIFVKYAPGNVFETRNNYFNESYIDELNYEKSNTTWYILFYKDVLKWFIFAFVNYIFLFKFDEVKTNQLLVKLLNIGVLFYGFYNVLCVVPSMHRFLTLGNLFLLSFIFIYYNSKSKIDNYDEIFSYIGIPVLLMFTIVRLRVGCDFLGLWSVVGSPFFVYFVENDIALVDIVKYIF